MNGILQLLGKEPVIFDGAMGTMLMASGLKAGETPEMWNLEKPSAVMEIHRRYYEAGSHVVHTNTFGANPVKLSDRGLAEKMESINLEAARIARQACPRGKRVAGDMGPTGKLMRPLGDLDPQRAQEGYRMQAEALLNGGVDFLSIETMFSLQEALAALKGAKRLGEIFVIVSLTFNRTKRGFFTMMGEGVSQVVSSLEEAGADAVGSNCTLGSRDMIDLTAQIRAATKKPLLIQPNAGKPVTRHGITTYQQSPTEFAEDGEKIKEAGADMIGGCCGTNENFIRELAKVLA